MQFVIQTPPVHGTWMQHPDGTFSYTPEANLNGTVSLTITPVNDAPVAADVTATVLEDNTMTITCRQINAARAKAARPA